MNPLFEEPYTSVELLRLRIHHLLSWMAVVSIVLVVQLGMFRNFRSNASDAVVPEIGEVASLTVVVSAIAVGIHLCIAAYGLIWRRSGYAFPSQPGHWLALYFAFSYLNETLLTVPMLISFSVDLPSVMRWLMIFLQISQFVFHGLLVYFWYSACRQETTKIWRWGWIAMAIRSALYCGMIALLLFAAMLEWVLEVLLYKQYSISQWLMLPIRSTSMWYFLLANFVCLAYLLAATTNELKSGRQRHWSHWFPLGCGLAATLTAAIFHL